MKTMTVGLSDRNGSYYSFLGLPASEYVENEGMEGMEEIKL